MLNRIILFFALSFLYQSLLAQQKIDWAKYDSLPFKEDTSIGFISRDYYNKQFCAIPEITKSDAILELRVMPPPITVDKQILTIRFYNDSTVLDGLYGHADTVVLRIINEYKDSSAEVYKKNIAPLLEKCGGYSWQHKQKNLSAKEAVIILNELVARGCLQLT